jgi:hypothetical protein
MLSVLPPTAFSVSRVSSIAASKQSSLQQNHGNSIAIKSQNIIFFNDMQQWLTMLSATVMLNASVQHRAVAAVIVDNSSCQDTTTASVANWRQILLLSAP